VSSQAGTPTPTLKIALPGRYRQKRSLAFTRWIEAKQQVARATHVLHTGSFYGQWR
jgi:hypothetical protein